MRIKLIIISLIIISCKSGNDFTIDGTIDADDGSKVYILYTFLKGFTLYFSVKKLILYITPSDVK